MSADFPSWMPMAANLLLACSLACPAQIVLQADAPPAVDKARSLAVPPPGSGAESPQSDRVQFLNGDALHGALVQIAPSTGVRWQHPAIKQVVDLDAQSVAAIKLARTRRAETNMTKPASVKLTNGDELMGELVGVDASALHLQTWYAGKISFPRSMVATLTFGLTNPAVIFEGPTSLEGWKASGSGNVRNNQGPRGWKYSNGSFVTTSPGSIGRDFKLPDMSNVEFDYTSQGYLQLMVCLYTDSMEGYGGNCYMLQMSNGYLTLQRMNRESGSTGLGQTEVPSLAQRNRAHINIRVNKETKTLGVLVDGQMVKQWGPDRGEFAGKGGSVVFYHQGQGTLKLSNIRISEWDGKVDDPSGPAAKGTNDLVRMLNNDKISGALQTINEGKLSFLTPFATLDVPVTRVSQVEMAPGKSVKPAGGAGDVRAQFVGRGSVTFSLQKWDESQVLGVSTNFGSLKFAPAAFQQIMFNLDKPRQEPESLDSGGNDSDGPPILE